MKSSKFIEDQALVKLISKANVKYMEIFSKNDISPNTNKMSKIFELMKNNEFLDIEKLQSEIYGDKKVSKSSFERLYYRFEEKLVNTLFFVDTNSSLFNTRESAYYNCSRRLCLTRILVHKGMVESAFLMAKKTLPISLQFEFTEISLGLCRHLVRYFSSRQLSKTNFEKYIKIFNELNKTFETEFEIQSFTSRLDFAENSRQDKNANITSSLKKYANQSKKLLLTNCSIDILMSITKIVYNMYLKDRNYSKFKKWMKVIFDKVLNKKFESIVSIELIINIKLQFGLINSDFIGADEIYDFHFNRLNSGSHNWFVLHFNYLLHLIHSKIYFKFYLILISVIRNSFFVKQPFLIKENFYILEAYSCFLIKIGKVLIKEQPEFRINKFINQVPEFTKDKAGINISIILLQVLYFLADKRFNKLIDRMESLKLYKYRYLKKNETFRSQCFIHLISEVIRSGFKRQGTMFRSNKWLIKLKAVPIRTYPESANIEIIPYEDLWEMVLELLD